MDFEDWHADFGAYRAVEWMSAAPLVAGICAPHAARRQAQLADAPRFIAYIRATAHRYRELAPLLRLIDGWKACRRPAAGLGRT